MYSDQQIKRLFKGIFGYHPIPLEAFYKYKELVDDDGALFRIYIPEVLGQAKLLPKVVELAEAIARENGLTKESNRLGIKCYCHPDRGIDECLVIWEVNDRQAVDGIGGYYIAYYYEPEIDQREGK